jgi:hypothetical protein
MPDIIFDRTCGVTTSANQFSPESQQRKRYRTAHNTINNE